MVLSAEQETEVRGASLISCFPVDLHSVFMPPTVPCLAPDRKASLDIGTMESLSGPRRATLLSQTESRHCVFSKISQSPTSSHSLSLMFSLPAYPPYSKSKIYLKNFQIKPLVVWWIGGFLALSMSL